MKSFKQFLQESNKNAGVPIRTNYVVVRNGRVELRSMSSSGPITTFAQGATTAVVQGNIVVVTLASGKVVTYKINELGSSVSGPYNR